jgi:hypothetical protein
MARSSTTKEKQSDAVTRLLSMTTNSTRTHSELKAVVSASLQRATHIRRSLLQQAFEGNLI